MKNIKRIITIIFTCTVISGYSNSAIAVEVTGLYKAETTVKDQTSRERKISLANAFAQVLIKVSGKSSVIRNTQIKKALRRAYDYMREYRYQMLPAEDGQAPQQMLLVQFDKTVVNQLLERAGVPLWGSARPGILVWMVKSEAGKRKIVGAGRSYIALKLQALAHERGLPLTLPLLDLDDRRSIKPSDIWGEFSGKIQKASQRYASDIILSGKMSQDNGRWKIQWLLNNQGRIQKWSTQGATKTIAMSEGINETANRISRYYARSANSDSLHIYSIWVDGINDISSYANLTGYLLKIDGVSQVQPETILPGSVRVELSASVSIDSILQSISFGRTLKRNDPDELTFNYSSQ